MGILIIPLVAKFNLAVHLSTRYSVAIKIWRITRPRFAIRNFTILLRLDLGHRLLVFALTTNLESGPRLADIW